MFTSRKISSKGHSECDNGSNSGINSVSVSTKFSLTSFYGAKYCVWKMLNLKKEIKVLLQGLLNVIVLLKTCIPKYTSTSSL